jgi:tRNA threonylcarbamoyl adenosine modification protein YeaZ
MKAVPNPCVSLLLDSSLGVTTAVFNKTGKLISHRMDDNVLAGNLALITESVLSRAPASYFDIEEVFLGLGPGSFTGLRAGIAFALGLCFPRSLPLYGYPSLAPRLPNPAEHGRGAAAMPAKRGYYYLSTNFAEGQDAAAEVLISTEDLLALSPEIPVLSVCGQSQDNARLAGNFLRVLDGSSLYDFEKARLIGKKLGPLPHHDIKPNYIQLPAAQAKRPGISPKP